MKATLEFDLVTEAEDHGYALHGRAWAALVWDLDTALRAALKYETWEGADPAPDTPQAAIAWARTQLRALATEAGLDLG